MLYSLEDPHGFPEPPHMLQHHPPKGEHVVVVRLVRQSALEISFALHPRADERQRHGQRQFAAAVSRIDFQGAPGRRLGTNS